MFLLYRYHNRRCHLERNLILWGQYTNDTWKKLSFRRGTACPDLSGRRNLLEFRRIFPNVGMPIKQSVSLAGMRNPSLCWNSIKNEQISNMFVKFSIPISLCPLCVFEPSWQNFPLSSLHFFSQRSFSHFSALISHFLFLFLFSSIVSRNSSGLWLI